MRKSQSSITPSHSVMTPYASKGWAVKWYEEQEESSRPRYSKAGGFEERISLPLRSVRRTLFGTRVPRSTYPPLNDQRQERDRSQGYSPRSMGHPWTWSWAIRVPTLQIGVSLEKERMPFFLTPFNRASMEALCPKKVRIPTIDSFDGTTNLDSHMDICKA